MTNFIFANDVNTSLAGPISSSSTSLTLSSTNGLPTAIPTGSVLVITLRDQATKQNTEIIYAGSISGATLSNLQRGQENTSALNWITGDYAYSGPTAGQMRALQGGRLLGSPTVITSSGTFTPNPSATLRRVIGIGGGGGGGGIASTNSSQAATACGGGSGAFAEVWFIGTMTSQAVTIGQGGIGGPAGNNNGGNGGSTVFGSLATFPGGTGGAGGSAITPPFINTGTAQLSGPVTTSGLIVFASEGSSSDYAIAVSGAYAIGSNGANSPFGVGGKGSAGGSGQSGNGYGSGGGGAGAGSSASAFAGADGMPGILIIEEYA